MPDNRFTNLTPAKWLARMALSAVLTGTLAALQACANDSKAEQHCVARPGIGNSVVTTCTDGTGGPPQQFRARAGIGPGSTITTGGGRTCVTRPAVGGGSTTTCR